MPPMTACTARGILVRTLALMLPAFVAMLARTPVCAQDRQERAPTSGVFDALQFGADPRGQQDSAPAFQRIADAIGGLRHIKITIGPGVYRLSAPIKFEASGNADTYGLAIQGAGQDVTELVVDNAEGGIHWRGEQINRMSFTVSDLSIVAAREHAGTALSFDKALLGVKHRTQFLAQNVLIRGAQFDVGHFDTGVLVRGAWFPRLSNVQVAGPYGPVAQDVAFATEHGILLEDSYNPMLSHCRVWSAADGLTLKAVANRDQAVEDGSILNSYFVGVRRGIVVDLKDPGVWEEPGLRITQCHIAYRDYGITLRGSRQATIDHCLLYCTDRAGAAFPMYQDTPPREFSPADINLEYASDVIIDGNLFTEPANPSRVAVRIGKRSGYVLIRGNQFNLQGVAVSNASPLPSWSTDNFFGGRRRFTRDGDRYRDASGSLVINDLN